MSTTTPMHAPGATNESGPQHDPPPGHRRRRAVIAGAATALVVAGAAVAIVLAHPFRGSNQSQTGVTDNAYPTSRATVKRGPLSSQVNSSGTLGYAAQADGSPYAVLNQATGAYSALPAVGQVVRCGQVLYRVSDNPVALLCGGTPMYRSLSEGDSGPDVKELNANLVALGYATKADLDPTSDYFSSETAYALEQLQGKLGVDETGSLTQAQALFLPGPLRIEKVTATLGGRAGPGAPVAQATTTTRQVQVNLDATEQASVAAGDHAQVTLPDNQTTQGVVSRIGSVANSSSSGPTIPVYITLDHPQDAGSLDQAPVQVQITTAGVKNALIVPVDSLLALAGGGYAVETVGSRGVHQLVPVTTGLFDDADGLVQVSSPKLAAGDQIVVPAT